MKVFLNMLDLIERFLITCYLIIPVRRFATIKQIEITGEACNALSDEVKMQHPSIPWKSIIGFRNISIHEYFGVNLHLVWEIANNDLPGLKEEMNATKNFHKTARLIFLIPLPRSEEGRPAQRGRSRRARSPTSKIKRSSRPYPNVLNIRIIQVIKTFNQIHPENFKDIADAYAAFGIRVLTQRIGYRYAVLRNREFEKLRVQRRIVFATQVAIQRFKRNIFSPLQLFK